MVIARMLLRGGLLTLALASTMAKLRLRATPNLREHDPSEYIADPPRSRDASPTPPILLSAAACEPACYECRSHPCLLQAPLRPSTLNALDFLDHALSEMKRTLR